MSNADDVLAMTDDVKSAGLPRDRVGYAFGCASERVQMNDLIVRKVVAEGDETRTVEDDAIIPTDEIYEDYRLLLQLCPMGDKRARTVSALSAQLRESASRKATADHRKET